MQQPFETASMSLDGMTKINLFSTQKRIKCILLILGGSRNKFKKNPEWDQNIAKMMTQMDLLSKNSMISA